MTKAPKSKKGKDYTYRDGRKVVLNKRRDQFVVSRLSDDVPVGNDPLQVPSTFSRVTCKPAELDGLMEKSRLSAVTHHAYEAAESGDDFLITDRIIVTFDKQMTPEEVGAFAGKYALEKVLKYSATEYSFRLTSATGMNPVKLVVKLVEGEPQLARVEHDLKMRLTTKDDVKS